MPFFLLLPVYLLLIHTDCLFTPSSLLYPRFNSQDLASSLDALARFSSAARAAAVGAVTSGAPPAAGGATPPLMPPGIAEAHLALVEQVCLCLVCLGVCQFFADWFFSLSTAV